MRRASTADSDAVKALLRDTFETTWRPHLTEDAAAGYVQTDRGGRYVDGNIEAMTVAEIEGRIVGMVHRDGGFIEALHVSSRHQRQGVGHLLLDRAEREIAGAGYETVRLETDTFNRQSRSFYKSQGYVEVDRYPDEEWDSGLTTVLLEKRLTA